MEVTASFSGLRSVPSYAPSISATAPVIFVKFPPNVAFSRTNRSGSRSRSQIVGPSNKPITVTLCVAVDSTDQLTVEKKELSVDKTIDIFRRRLQASSKPPIQEFLSFLKFIAGKQQYSTVISLYEELRATEILPNTDFYTLVMNCYCKLGNTQAALDLMRKIKKGGGAKPDVLTYSVLINGLCKAKKADVALELFREMQDGKKTKPNPVVYTTLIGGLCKIGNLDAAFQLMEEMKRVANGKRKVLTYNILIEGLCNAGKHNAAIDLMREMKEGKKTQPDVGTYSKLIDGLCKAGNYNVALELMREMKAGGNGKPKVFTYNALIDGLRKAGNENAALELTREMEEEVSVKADVVN